MHYTEKLEKALQKIQDTKIPCDHCKKLIVKGNLERHMPACPDNPENIKSCLYCKKSFFAWRGVKLRKYCSSGCYQQHFFSISSSQRKKKKKETHKRFYQKICFSFHKKKCVCCDEENIVCVHHLDHNRLNNDPRNLIPMCPTHHSYWHSQFKPMVEEKVLAYAAVFAKTYKGR